MPGRDREDRCGGEGSLRGRRGPRLRRGERSRCGAFRKAGAGAAEGRSGERSARSRRGICESGKTNGSGSHFQVDETSLPQVAAGSHFQVDQSRRAARARGRKGRGLSFAASKSAHGRAAIDPGRSRGDPGKRQRRAGHDQRSGNISRRPGETNCGRRERDPHRRGRCDAAQLDATARHGRRFRLSRSRVGRPQEARSETGSCFVCAARTCARSGGNAKRGLASDWRSRAALRVDRYRRRGGSAGRNHGSGDSQRGQNFAR